MTKPKAKYCTFHCSGCGSHFSSLRGFDAHRQGEFSEGRYCVEPEDVVRKDGTKALALLSDAGECRLGRPHQSGVKVWTERVGLERAHRRFGEAA